MFEITYNDSDTLQNFIDADKAYHGAVYDFTFEGRFILAVLKALRERGYINDKEYARAKKYYRKLTGADIVIAD